MGIPDTFAHVAHAVALNEYRSADSAWGATRRNLPSLSHFGGFPLESIGASSTDLDGKVRIERGFVGAHADIGGGYPGGENQLSFVALSWMVAQAQQAGVKMNTSVVPAISSNDPIIHDQSNALRVGDPTANDGRFTVLNDSYTVEDRRVNGAVSGNSARTMGFTDLSENDKSLRHADTLNFINYLPRNMDGLPNTDRTWRSPEAPQQVNGGTNQTGTVKIDEYMRWMRSNGYCLAGDTCAKARS
jgi:hypothetical protein